MIHQSFLGVVVTITFTSTAVRAGSVNRAPSRVLAWHTIGYGSANAYGTENLSGQFLFAGLAPSRQIVLEQRLR